MLAMAIAMAALTGARRGELCGMQWSDIDPAMCSITIERQWVPGKGGQYLAPPKSEDGVRSIVLGQLGLGLIERYRDIMREMLRREPEGWLLSYDAGATPLPRQSAGPGDRRPRQGARPRRHHALLPAGVSHPTGRRWHRR